jgi:L-alanine-DL-glutamate epimerase-like enolase superfamily enzyme
VIKIAHLAEAFRMKCEIHHGGNSLNNVANLHLTMAVPNCEYFEVLQPDAAQKHGLVQDIEVDRAGLVHAPTAPGLGYEIDWELVNRNKVAELS